MKKLMLLSTVVMLVCSCNSAGGGDPKAVLKNFFDALKKKDVTAAKKYATKDSESLLNMMEMGMKMAPAGGEQDKMFNKFDLEVGDPKIDGDMATVPVKEKQSGESTNFILKKESGDWKVAFDKGTMMEMGQQKMKEKGMNMNQLMDSINDMHSKMGGKKDMTLPDSVINGTPQ